MPNVLAVSEVFGPTFQGEGPAAGRRAAFVRFGGCNLSCSWCDSAFTWDASRFDLHKEITSMSVDDVLDRIDRMGVNMVVLSGGEPLLQQRRSGWGELCKALHDTRAIDIHIETNGTLSPWPATWTHVQQFVVSPKMPSAGQGFEPWDDDAVTWFVRDARSAFKFVCRDHHDVVCASEFIDRFAIARRRVWLMPEGQTAAEVEDHASVVWHGALALGVNFSPRLHIWLFGDRRGV